MSQVAVANEGNVLPTIADIGLFFGMSHWLGFTKAVW